MSERLMKAQEDRVVQAMAVSRSCPDGCAYIEDGRQPECDAMTGAKWLMERMRCAWRAGR
ncbi:MULTISPECIES: hypothetical protein [unclassified Bosea (in: a-proteobacteria)]|uniref:hypothetical protein n=1 Tax=unclassified Bosea (in: a-proteobacteria) TaxID=2653178 RepID=UPI000F759B0C|nr:MULTISPECIES: hypothetical protein [unclassified Bosea (in: a-proteobacteria)]AZO78077.1 hypothetical protein BLM15_11005 [Bosea sp. Tri-49]RXT20446.1 hypothetical protein B5U98_21015 [Bosea sp. Tri-39]RXT37318.1 hypothetical protein B5U99_15330 [Bosea sp. Tri-54]